MQACAVPADSDQLRGCRGTGRSETPFFLACRKWDTQSRKFLSSSLWEWLVRECCSFNLISLNNFLCSLSGSKKLWDPVS